MSALERVVPKADLTTCTSPPPAPGCQIQTQHHSCVLTHVTILQQAVMMVTKSGGLPSNPQWMGLAMLRRTGPPPTNWEGPAVSHHHPHSCVPLGSMPHEEEGPCPLPMADTVQHSLPWPLNAGSSAKTHSPLIYPVLGFIHQVEITSFFLFLYRIQSYVVYS